MVPRTGLEPAQRIKTRVSFQENKIGLDLGSRTLIDALG
jgi:hypothetical protein